MSMKLLLCLSAVAVSFAAQSKVAVTPVEKVTTLLSELAAQVEKEGTEEATAYDTFACFCKTKTEGLSSTITKNKEDVDVMSEDVELKTKEKALWMEDLSEAKKKQEKNKADLAETEARLAKEKDEYDFDLADLTKAVDSLTGAVQALGDAKPTFLIALRKVVKSGVVATKLRQMKTPAAHALLQTGVDPNDPEYKYHSQGILDTLDGLKEEFTAKRTELMSEWTKNEATLNSLIAGLKADIDNTKNAMDALEISIEDHAGLIAGSREALVGLEAMMKDDQVYLADLTERCEDRANDWDQRSKMRADELTALNSALDILNTKVAARDTYANQRSEYPELLEKGAAAPKAARKAWSAPASFVQVRSHSVHDMAVSQQQQQAQNKVLEMLTQTSMKLHSKQLSVLAMKITADPFGKVKGLIQDLLERLLQESINEANKEGFCNEELGKANKDRDFRYKDVVKLNTEIKGLELKKDELEAEIEELEAAIDTLKNDLKEADDDRKTEHANNMMVIKTGSEGLRAITEAIVVIKTFYSQAAKAVSLVQASPVDEDTSGPGFKGNYGGKQQASQSIIGMLEVIKTDFERSISKTTASEEKAAADFVKFERSSMTSIVAKERKYQLDREDLKTTDASIAQGMSELETNMNLLDAALEKLAELQPMCTDFGQSYADRVAEREKEILALKNAICMLAPPDDPSAEPDCATR